MTDRSVYRIIDANFNRGREACRVIEEFCRFVLNSEPLSEKTKQLRHELCHIISKLDQTRLIASRDTESDVGVGLEIDNQMPRQNLFDTFTAACKRLPEALRVIAEMLKTIDPVSEQQVEQLRYQFYTLEKVITLHSIAYEKFKKVKLYVIITSDFPSEILTLASQCVKGGADCIQLRSKKMSADKLFETAQQVVGFCQQADVLTIINDRIDIAAACGADGVHLGQNDLAVAEAKRLATSPLIIGKTTHNMEQLKNACGELPTYVSLGPVYPTQTKPEAEAVGLEYIKKGTEFLKDKGITHVAIGAISKENLSDVIRAGAQKIAVCSAVSASKDPEAACKEIQQKITKLSQ